jgi:hypothetical protein
MIRGLSLNCPYGMHVSNGSKRSDPATASTRRNFLQHKTNIVAFDAAEESSAHHFLETRTMIEAGKSAEREVLDYFLSRGAC